MKFNINDCENTQIVNKKTVLYLHSLNLNGRFVYFGFTYSYINLCLHVPVNQQNELISRQMKKKFLTLK